MVVAEETSVFFPDDIIFLILLCLPAVEVYQMKLVCKSWYVIITSAAFIQALLKKSNQGLIFCDRRIGFRNAIHQGKISLREFSKKSRMIWGSCNGLVLLEDVILEEETLFLANPVTRKHLRLPLSNSKWEASCLDHRYGIAYMASIDRYVVAHYVIFKWSVDDTDEWFLNCEMLCVGDDCWKTLYQKPSNIELEFSWYQNSIIFIDNEAHMLVWERDGLVETFLYSLDMINKKVYKTKVPRNSNEMFVIGGVLSFALQSISEDTQTDLNDDSSQYYDTDDDDAQSNSTDEDDTHSDHTDDDDNTECGQEDNHTQFEIWSLQDFRTGGWVMTRKIEIEVNGIVGSIVATLENGKLLIGRYFYQTDLPNYEVDGCFTYDIELKEVRYLDFSPHRIGGKLLPHVDSLVSTREMSLYFRV